MDHDLDALERDLLDPARGYVVLRGFLSPPAADAYREECREFLRRGRRIHVRMNRPGIPDYVHPRTAPSNLGRKSAGEEPDTYRIYQFRHNRHSSPTEDVFDRALAVRNAIEERWIHDPAYAAVRARLHDYFQVTRFVERSLGLPRHRDADPSGPYPLLQPFLLLSTPDVDFRGGALVLHPAKGTSVRSDRDLGLAKGDLVLFDKRMEHEVEPTRPAGENALGRWSAVPGARSELAGGRWTALRHGTFARRVVRPVRRKARGAVRKGTRLGRRALHDVRDAVRPPRNLPLLLAAFEVPGLGGAGTAHYRLYRSLRAGGRDAGYLNLVPAQEADGWRRRFGAGFGNPDRLPEVHTHLLTGAFYGPHPELARLLRRLRPRAVLARGYIAALLVRRAAPETPVVLLVSGSRRAKQAIQRGLAPDLTTYLRMHEAGNAPAPGAPDPEAEAVAAADLLVFLSDLARSLTSRLFPEAAGKSLPGTLPGAAPIREIAAAYGRRARPFPEREIDLLFAASSWSRPEKNAAWAAEIARRNPDLRVHAAGEWEDPPPEVTSHGLVTDPARMFALYGNAKVLVCPSRLEAGPNVLHEAAAMGCNVVASANCGYAGICPPGLLADPFTLDAFQLAIRRALEGPRPARNEEKGDPGAAVDAVIRALEGARPARR